MCESSRIVAELRSRFAEMCRETSAESAQGDTSGFAEKVYDSLHCKVDRGKQKYAELTSSSFSLVRAYASLQGCAVPRTGWTGWNANRSALRDGTGVEVVPPADTVVTETPDGWVFSAPSIALDWERHWLQWNSETGLPERGYRVYVSADPRHAYDTWVSIASALAGLDVPSAVKVAVTPELSHRADCIVAYGDEAGLPLVVSAVRGAVDDAWLSRVGPGFAVPVTAGIHVGLSDGPLPFDESVGWTWSKRLAEAHAEDGERAQSVFWEIEDLFDRMTSGELFQRFSGSVR